MSPVSLEPSFKSTWNFLLHQNFSCDIKIIFFLYNWIICTKFMILQRNTFSGFVKAMHTSFMDWFVKWFPLTHWGRVTHISTSKLAIIDSGNVLLPGQHQAIIWTNAGILFIGPLGTNFNEILVEIYIFSFKKMHLKMSSGKWRPFCRDLNVLNNYVPPIPWLQ